VGVTHAEYLANHNAQCAVKSVQSSQLSMRSSLNPIMLNVLLIKQLRKIAGKFTPIVCAKL
jgi:hypothetical protein